MSHLPTPNTETDLTAVEYNSRQWADGPRTVPMPTIVGEKNLYNRHVIRRKKPAFPQSVWFVSLLGLSRQCFVFYRAYTSMGYRAQHEKVKLRMNAMLLISTTERITTTDTTGPGTGQGTY